MDTPAAFGAPADYLHVNDVETTAHKALTIKPTAGLCYRVGRYTSIASSGERAIDSELAVTP